MANMDYEKEEALALRDRCELEGTLLPIASAVPISKPNLPEATATPIDFSRTPGHPGTTAAQLAPLMFGNEQTVPSNYPDQDRYKRGDDVQLAALATHSGRMAAHQEREMVRQVHARTATFNAQQEQGVAIANFAAHQENLWEQCNLTVPIATPPVVADAIDDNKKDEEYSYAFGTGKGGYEVQEYDVKEYNTRAYEISEYKSVYE